MIPTRPVRAGTFGVVRLGVGRTADDGRVHDCPACGDWFPTDEWHVSAVVRDVSRDGGRETYLFCDDDCLAGWLALFDAPRGPKGSGTTAGDKRA